MLGKEEFNTFKDSLSKQNVQLVAVSKVHPASKIQTVYDYGHRVFGENRAQEMAEKYEQLPKDIKWHMIGPLQTNKVKYIIDFVDMIESVDRVKVLKEIQKRAKRINRTIDVLLQLHIAEEEQKHGFTESEVRSIIESKEQYDHISIRGFMGMSTLTDDENKIKKEFSSLKELFDQIKKEQPSWETFDTLSMGMTGDYPLAIESGSNCVRIGSMIFGQRPKH
jgi:pyridoxal phosphate enzyme (YggS family)